MAEPPARQSSHHAQLLARQPAVVASRLQDAEAEAEAEANADVQQPPAKSVSPQTKTSIFTEVGRTGATALGKTLGASLETAATKLGTSLEAAAMTHRSGTVVLGASLEAAAVTTTVGATKMRNGLVACAIIWAAVTVWKGR